MADIQLYPIVTLFAGLFFGAILGGLINSILTQRAAFRAGRAHYHPQTGAFTWGKSE